MIIFFVFVFFKDLPQSLSWTPRALFIPQNQHPRKSMLVYGATLSPWPQRCSFGLRCKWQLVSRPLIQFMQLLNDSGWCNSLPCTIQARGGFVGLWWGESLDGRQGRVTRSEAHTVMIREPDLLRSQRHTGSGIIQISKSETRTLKRRMRPRGLKRLAQRAGNRTFDFWLPVNLSCNYLGKKSHRVKITLRNLNCLYRWP